MTETDYPTRPVTVTCATEGCANAGAALDVSVPADDQVDPVVICGVCGQPITAVADREASTDA